MQEQEEQEEEIERERGRKGAFFKGILNSLNALVNIVFYLMTGFYFKFFAIGVVIL